MAHADDIPKEALAGIAGEVGERIRDFERPGAQGRVHFDPARPEFTLGESFALYVCGLEDVRAAEEPDADLIQIAKPTGRFHHQVRYRGEGFAYARSAEGVVGEHSLRQLRASPLAKRIDEAIALIDLHERLEGRDSLTRLLVAPAYQVYAFWLIDEAGPSSRVLVVDAPERLAGLPRGRFLSSREFLEALRRARPQTGVS